jgi:hypothetical protein
MTNKHCDSVPIETFLDVIDELEMKQKEAYDILGVSKQQFYNWKKKGVMPANRYWAFQKEIAVFLQKQLIRKLFRIGLVDKEFLKELLEI